MDQLPLTIKEYHKNLREKKYTVSHITAKYLSRIEKYDKELNSFITIANDQAYEQAKKYDQILEKKGESAFEEYPLLGVPIAFKDIYLTKGIRTTAASKVLESYIPPYSATVVKNLENAGVILLGKLNMDAWAHGSSGENSDFGPTKNPWNTDYVPGGSSSGSAAAVSADFCLVATSTDTCGSTRLPANYCGLVGLKPTYGAVSRYGVIAMASSLDTIGHITNSVNDSRQVFNVTKGEDGLDSTVKNEKFGKSADKIRIGVPKEFFIDGIDSEVRVGVDKAIEKYKELGVEFVGISLPHTKYGISAYYIIQPAEVSSNLGRYDGIRFGNNRESFGAEAKRRIMLGTYVLSAGYYDAYYLKAMKVRSIIIEEVNKAFEKVDAIIAPVAPTPPFKIGEKIDDPLTMYLTDIFAATANLSGIPSLALPAGFTKSGLPLGFQLMGPRFSENTLFDLGELYQEHTDFHTKKPSL